MRRESQISMGHGERGGRRFYAADRVLVAAALVLAGVLAFHGLGNHVFTEDEANTALFARNLIEFGTRTAWDGRNLIGYAFGEELDENLSNIKIPPQQFYIAAAGMTLFGDSTWGARVLFVIVGILAIALTAWWATAYFGTGDGTQPGAGLVAVLLAASPAYLLAIRNCRYFSPSVFWAILLLALWTVAAARAGGAGGAAPRHPRARGILLGAGGACAVLGLFTSNDLVAASTLAALPVFFLDHRFRKRSQAGYLVLLYLIALPFAVRALFRLNVFSELVTRREAAAGPWWETFGVLVWRHVRDMGTFEYFAWPLLLPLLFPWCVTKLRPQLALARRGLVLGGMMAAQIVFLSLVSPTRIDLTEYADMRYLLPLIPAGALVGAASIIICWRLFPPAGVGLGMVLVLTNALYAGAPRDSQPRFLRTERARIRSTLADYVHENFHPYRSAFGRVIDWLETVPPGTEVRVIPFNVVYPAMYSVPGLRYCAQLSTERPVREELARELPDYVYDERCRPALLLIHPSATGGEPLRETMTRTIRGSDGRAVVLNYRYEGIAATHWPDGSGPNVPFHYFFEPPAQESDPGFLIYRLVTEP